MTRGARIERIERADLATEREDITVTTTTTTQTAGLTRLSISTPATVTLAERLRDRQATLDALASAPAEAPYMGSDAIREALRAARVDIDWARVHDALGALLRTKRIVVRDIGTERATYALAGGGGPGRAPEIKIERWNHGDCDGATITLAGRIEQLGAIVEMDDCYEIDIHGADLATAASYTSAVARAREILAAAQAERGLDDGERELLDAIRQGAGPLRVSAGAAGDGSAIATPDEIAARRLVGLGLARIVSDTREGLVVWTPPADPADICDRCGGEDSGRADECTCCDDDCCCAICSTMAVTGEGGATLDEGTQDEGPEPEIDPAPAPAKRAELDYYDARQRTAEVTLTKLGAVDRGDEKTPCYEARIGATLIARVYRHFGYAYRRGGASDRQQGWRLVCLGERYAPGTPAAEDGRPKRRYGDTLERVRIEALLSADAQGILAAA